MRNKQWQLREELRDECEEDKSGTDSDNLTSENNERVREQAQKIFNEVRKKCDRKGDQNESMRRREKSSKSTPVKRPHKPKKSKPER